MERAPTDVTDSAGQRNEFPLSSHTDKVASFTLGDSIISRRKKLGIMGKGQQIGCTGRRDMDGARQP